ncbi:MAG: preprotein translocase subunit SecG [Patescibacteria group bacterium]|nr:preprotein translocase subunit SecG [Patescibacteria group bacterium]
MENFLSIIQIIVAILLIIFILVQQQGTALGSAFGGGGGEGGGSGGFYATKRGIQQKIYWATIILGILFISLTILDLVI